MQGVKAQLGLIDVSWSKFLNQIRAAAAHRLDDAKVSEFFDRVLGRKLLQALDLAQGRALARVRSRRSPSATSARFN
jgi:hypothetical protein